MVKAIQDQNIAGNGPLGASALIDRLHQVRKRKKAYSGQAVDLRVIQRRLAAERRGKHER
jgi:hypothetical protein